MIDFGVFRMGVTKGIMGTESLENLEMIFKGIVALITIAMYLTVIRKSKAIKFIIIIFGAVSIITSIILIVTKNVSEEIKSGVISSIFFCIVTLVGIKGAERLEEIDEIIKEQKCFKKVDYNIKGKKLTKKELKKIKDNLYNYFRFFEFNSYDANIGKLKIDIERISDKIIKIEVDHTLSDKSEIYYYDIVNRYESLKNNNFIDEVDLRYDNQFNKNIKLTTKIITEE